MNRIKDVDGRDEPTAVRLEKSGVLTSACSGSSSQYSLALSIQDCELESFESLDSSNRTAVGLSRPSTPLFLLRHQDVGCPRHRRAKRRRSSNGYARA